MTLAFDAYVTSVLFDRSGRAAFALGDGAVRFESDEVVDAHPNGAVLCAVAHPSGEGVITGGDDGRLVWSRPEGAVELAAVKGRWIDAVDASVESGLIAYAAGRDLHVLDSKDAKFARTFAHEKSVADVAFDAKGRRIAAATYGGAALWFARIDGQKPTMLKWAGSHVAAAFSPDGKFLVTAMQENAMHGWRLSDAKDMRMGGYPSKPKSIAFLAKGSLMATSGAPGVVLWPFGGANGPMGREAIEIGHDEATLISKVAATPQGSIVAAGLEDGRVWVAELSQTGVHRVRSDTGSPITALAMSPDESRLAWGDEDGNAGIVALRG
jgi:WD40 repeat protein